MIYQYVWTKTDLGFDLHFLWWRGGGEEEREGDGEGAGLAGEGKEGRKTEWLIWKSLGQVAIRIQKDAAHEVFPNSYLPTHQKLMESKTFSTMSCLIELVHVMGGSCFSEPK